MAEGVNSSPSFIPAPMENAPSSKDAVVEAAKTLGRLAPPTEHAGAAVAALAKVLRSGSTPQQRVAAAKALGNFPIDPYFQGPGWQLGQPLHEVHADPLQIAALTAALGDAETPVRAAALRAFHDVGMKTRFAASDELNAAMAKALDDPAPEVRFQAAAAIHHYGDVADPFFPALVRHGEHDPNEDVRSMCCSAICLNSGGLPARVTKGIIPILNAALASDEGGVRWAACRMLRRFGPDARPAIPALIRAMQQPAKNQTGLDDRSEAAETLAQLAPEHPRPPMRSRPSRSSCIPDRHRSSMPQPLRWVASAWPRRRPCPNWPARCKTPSTTSNRQRRPGWPAP